MLGGPLLASVLTLALAPAAGRAQNSPSPETTPTRTTFVRLGSANAIVVELATPNPAKGRIAILVVHPERVNAFNYFIGRTLPQYGYRVMMLNTYSDEVTYDEFVAPIAAGIKALRAMPGVEKVVLAGHSTGGPELTSYQDIAENGAKACQGPERIYKCRITDFNLPKADGLMLLDSNAGAPERTIAINPAVVPGKPRERNAAIDMYAAANGYDSAKKSATYSAPFQKTYFAAQLARSNSLIAQAQARLALIEKGLGDYTDDEPFVVQGSDLHVNGARLDLADVRLLSKTRAPHLLLKADGTRPVQVLQRLTPAAGRPDDQRQLNGTVLNYTVRYYLSFQALKLNPDYAVKEDGVTGVNWRSTPNSVPGNVEGIRVPTLIMGATCAQHMVFSEIAFDHSAAADKEFVGLEGANHGLQPCKPEYGDTYKRAFDYVDGWLSKPGRF
jgi:pimeloyl-ACP methyl ester carboxylesterase